jgi:tRNA A-37 threonylcarbamoyl transferase component Bud32
MRFTKKIDLEEYGYDYVSTNKPCADYKLGQLEDIEEDLGVDLISFLKEMSHLMKTASQTTGYTTSGKEITTDYGYVEDFLQQLKGALE